MSTLFAKRGESNLLHIIAHKFGTPLYLYSEEKIRSQYTALSSALSGINYKICFAVKANSNLSILQLVHECGAGFDIVSIGELERVLKVTGTGENIVYSGVGKLETEIERALEIDIKFFNVESASELRLIEKLAAKHRTIARVAFRVNPDISVETHPYLSTGMHSNKFGLPIKDVYELFEAFRGSKHLSFVGIDCHIGSQITNVAPLREAYSSIIKIADDFVSKGAPIKFVDLGGGLGVGFSGHYEPLNLEQFRHMILAVTKDRPYQFLIEPGKFLVADSGSLLTKVVYVKKNGAKKFAIVDAGMNDLIRPSLYQAYHKIDLVSPHEDREIEIVDIVGPVCETGCYFARDREMPEINEGDLVAIRDTGAYGFTMASNYNSRPLPPEVLLRADGSYKLIRPRQELDSLWKDEEELLKS